MYVHDDQYPLCYRDIGCNITQSLRRGCCCCCCSSFVTALVVLSNAYLRGYCLLPGSRGRILSLHAVSRNTVELVDAVAFDTWFEQIFPPFSCSATFKNAVKHSPTTVYTRYDGCLHAPCTYSTWQYALKIIFY